MRTSSLFAWVLASTVAVAGAHGQDGQPAGPDDESEARPENAPGPDDEQPEAEPEIREDAGSGAEQPEAKTEPPSAEGSPDSEAAAAAPADPGPRPETPITAPPPRDPVRAGDSQKADDEPVRVGPRDVTAATPAAGRRSGMRLALEAGLFIHFPVSGPSRTRVEHHFAEVDEHLLLVGGFDWNAPGSPWGLGAVLNFGIHQNSGSHASVIVRGLYERPDGWSARLGLGATLTCEGCEGYFREPRALVRFGAAYKFIALEAELSMVAYSDMDEVGGLGTFGITILLSRLRDFAGSASAPASSEIGGPSARAETTGANDRPPGSPPLKPSAEVDSEPPRQGKHAGRSPNGSSKRWGLFAGIGLPGFLLVGLKAHLSEQVAAGVAVGLIGKGAYFEFVQRGRIGFAFGASLWALPELYEGISFRESQKFTDWFLGPHASLIVNGTRGYVSADAGGLTETKNVGQQWSPTFRIAGGVWL